MPLRVTITMEGIRAAMHENVVLDEVEKRLRERQN
jgi:hypothetical protein